MGTHGLVVSADYFTLVYRPTACNYLVHKNELACTNDRLTFHNLTELKIAFR